MTRASVAAFALVVLAAVALAALVIALWIDVVTRMGVAAAGTLMLLEGLAALTRALIPVSMKTWSQGRAPADGDPPTVGRRRRLEAAGIELALAALVAIVLVATARWWAGALQVNVAWWIPAAIVVRAAARKSLLASSNLTMRATVPLPALVALLDLLFVTWLVALVDASLGFVAVGTMATTAALAVLAVLVATRPPSPEILAKLSPQEPEPPGSMVVTWGGYLAALASSVTRPYLAWLLGAAMLIPYSAVCLLMSIIYLPFMIAALASLDSRPWRLVRGLGLALACWAIAHELGPGLYRAVFPEEFTGGAEIMTAAAWFALGLAPISLGVSGRPQRTWRLAVPAATGVVLLLWLTPRLGLEGILYATAASNFVSAVLGLAKAPTTGRLPVEP